MISADDFDAWRANPVTEYVSKALAARADAIKEALLAKAWAGLFDPVEHAASSAMYEAYRTLSEMSREDLLTVNGDSTEDAEEDDQSV